MLVISPDDHLYTEDGTYYFTDERRHNAWVQSIDLMKDTLRDDPSVNELVLMCGIPASGKSTWSRAHSREGVIHFDGVFSRPQFRESIIGHARSVAGDRVKVTGLIMRTPFEVCQERNAQRTPDRRIPDEPVKAMWESLYWNLPTTWDGFNEIIWDQPPTLWWRFRHAVSWVNGLIRRVRGSL